MATTTTDASGNYTFSGTGAITSIGTLRKSGSGLLTINNSGPNAFTAATLESGTLTIGANALGSDEIAAIAVLVLTLFVK